MITLAVIAVFSLYFQGSNGQPNYPKDWCPSNVIEGKCSDYIKCKTGYTCGKKTNLCCKDRVCPANWIEGNKCTVGPGGMKTCPAGYLCMPNDFCCRSTVCPSGLIGPECGTTKCKTGYICREGYCCHHKRCPEGWIEGEGVCNLQPGKARCPKGYDCKNDFCCKEDPTYCSPSKKSKDTCYGNAKCPYGYECKKGICCQKQL